MLEKYDLVIYCKGINKRAVPPPPVMLLTWVMFVMFWLLFILLTLFFLL